MPAPIIRLKNISKRYGSDYPTINRMQSRAILRSILPFGRAERPKLRPREYWALDDVSLDIHAGETVAIIGMNGAGKSTLLRTLSGNVQPDFGSVRVRGQVSKLMSLSVEFQKHLTGRENVYLAGALRGLGYRQMRKLYDSMVEFSEIGEYIDAPVSTFSQGMILRLAFAIAVHVDSPIMLVDEVMGVGDIAFRRKCLAKLKELRESRTYVLVSHSMNEVKDFCERGIVLSHGKIVFDGPVAEAVDYLQKEELASRAAVPGAALEKASAPADATPTAPARVTAFYDETIIDHVRLAWINRKGEPLEAVALGAEMRMRLGFDVLRAPREPLNVHVQIAGHEVERLASFSNRSGGVNVPAKAGDRAMLTAEISQPLLSPGAHKVTVAIFEGTTLIFRDELQSLVIEGKGVKIWGEIQFRPTWDVEVRPLAHTNERLSDAQSDVAEKGAGRVLQASGAPDPANAVSPEK